MLDHPGPAYYEPESLQDIRARHAEGKLSDDDLAAWVRAWHDKLREREATDPHPGPPEEYEEDN